MYKRSQTDLKFLGYIYENYKVTNNGVAYLKIPFEVSKSFNIQPMDTARRINTLADTEGIVNFLFFAENEDGHISSEFRSNNTPVNDIAFKFGGGGHMLAAGASLEN